MASTIKVNNIQNQCGANIANKCGTTITLGASGDTVTLASGASQTGFGRTGTVDWDTTAKTASFTAVSGNGYFVNTTSGAITVTLPASPSAGDIVAVADYAGTAATNNITIARNGSNFQGGTDNASIYTQRQTATFVYVDATQGWVPVNSNDQGFEAPSFVTATGGTVTTCGNYKIHTFTSPGTFCVSCAGNSGGSNTVDYLVVAGGGGSGRNGGGGGGGGFRESSGAASGCYATSPLGAAVSALPVSVIGYPITVGGGGSGGTPGATYGVQGSNSVFSTITSAGGGGGASYNCASPFRDGGSGSGGGAQTCSSRIAGSGNTPPVSPPQGKDGGAGSSNCAPGYSGGGGGGAIAAGTAGSSTTPPIGGGDGGNGATTSISASSTSYSGGGGGGTWDNNPGGTGGTGGGGNGATGANAGTAGTTNTGGGGGGPSSANTGCSSPSAGVAGGSGIVIIRYKYQ